MKQNRKIIIAAVIVVALVAVMAVVYALTRPETAEGAKTITVEVIHSDGSAKTFTYHTDGSYLGEVLLAEGLIGGDDASPGMYTIVDGEQAVYEDNGSYWALYEGEDYAQQGIDQTPIADGGTFSLVYTIG